jgi:hypothetical protein
MKNRVICDKHPRDSKLTNNSHFALLANHIKETIQKCVSGNGTANVMTTTKSEINDTMNHA